MVDGVLVEPRLRLLDDLADLFAGDNGTNRLVDARGVEQPLETVRLADDPRALGPALGFDRENAGRTHDAVRDTRESDVQVVQDLEPLFAQFVQGRFEAHISHNEASAAKGSS